MKEKERKIVELTTQRERERKKKHRIMKISFFLCLSARGNGAECFDPSQVRFDEVYQLFILHSLMVIAKR